MIWWYAFVFVLILNFEVCLKLEILGKLQWKESYFKYEESYQKQWQEKIDLEKNLSKLKKGECFRQ